VKPELVIYRDAALLGAGVAELVCEVLERAEAPSLVLSGGSTPRGIYERMASSPLRERIPWSALKIFWGDERCVGPEDPESNFRMAREAMLGKVQPGGVYRIEAERGAAEAAERYEQTIRRAQALEPGAWPRFTLVLLGLGTDGHTASLFPGTPVLEERQRIVAPVFVPKLGVHRVTLTAPALRHAGEILVVIQGKAKAPIVRDVLSGNAPGAPITQITASGGRLRWLLDGDAASLLPGGTT